MNPLKPRKAQFSASIGVYATLCTFMCSPCAAQQTSSGAVVTGPFGGFSDSATGVNSVVVGGISNSAAGEESVIAGGVLNLAGTYGTVVGGYANNAAASVSVIVGGAGNGAGNYGTVIGGVLNVAGDASAICGGAQNLANRWGSIVGGSQNTTGQVGFIGGGARNMAGAYGAVGGGALNTAGEAAFVGGGTSNQATGSGSAVLGGSQNRAQGGLSAVVGGYRATALTTGSVIIADAQNSDVATTLTNQILLRAGGGVVLASTLGGANDVLGTVGTFYSSATPVVDVANAPANPGLAGTRVLNIPQGNVIELVNSSGVQRIISSIQPIRPKGTVLTLVIMDNATFQIEFKDAGGLPATPIDLPADEILTPRGVLRLVSTGKSYSQLSLLND